MSIKAKIFPLAASATLLACLGPGCGAAGTKTLETPCERDCADGFVACLENCVDESTCRDECMAERSKCAQECPEPPSASGDAGVPDPDADA
jgi:hypothetical protein